MDFEKGLIILKQVGADPIYSAFSYGAELDEVFKKQSAVLVEDEGKFHKLNNVKANTESLKDGRFLGVGAVNFPITVRGKGVFCYFWTKPAYWSKNTPIEFRTLYITQTCAPKFRLGGGGFTCCGETLEQHDIQFVLVIHSLCLLALLQRAFCSVTQLPRVLTVRLRRCAKRIEFHNR